MAINIMAIIIMTINIMAMITMAIIVIHGHSLDKSGSDESSQDYCELMICLWRHLGDELEGERGVGYN